MNKSVIYSDCWKTNERLTNYGAKEYCKVKHSKSEFVNEKFHINAIVIFLLAMLVTLQEGVMQTKEKFSLKAKLG